MYIYKYTFRLGILFMNNVEHDTKTQHLEPRVAKLEGQLDRLTDDVRSLASIVREQGTTVEKQLSELTVAVTQAAGPRKTDWSVIISAVLLVMAIGSAAFWPLNQISQENKVAIEELNKSFQNHEKINIHPVGSVILQRLENKLENYINKQDLKEDEEIKRLKEELLLWKSKSLKITTD